MRKENPYQPPDSPLLAQSTTRPPRPTLLIVGVGVLAVEMLFNLLLTLAQVWYLKQAGSTEDYSQILVGAVGLALVEAPLLWLLMRGKSWPRYVAALLLAAGLYDLFSRVDLSALEMLSAREMRDWLSYGLMVAGVALLFAPIVSKWFRQVRPSP